MCIRKTKQILFTVLAVMLSLAMISAAGAEGGHEEAKAAAFAYLKGAVATKCPIQTYETDDPLIASASYTYENAMAALALMSEGDNGDAAKILDAMVKGMNKDAEFKDRFRNSRMAGKASDLPGYWNDAQGKWLQDAYQVGTSTKSSAAAVVALLTYYAADPKEEYLDAARTGLDWILANCADENEGFTSGYTGWPNAGQATVLTYKSTTDNLWLAAACRMMAEATGWDKYREAETSALTFVRENMLSPGDSRFFEGTKDDGVTPSTDLIVADAQVLAELCMNDDSGMDNLEVCLASDGGYAFDNSCTDGSLLENTAMAALALKRIGETEAAEAALAMMETVQLSNGTFPQASIPELRTGEAETVFNDWPSVGPCAWFILAVNGQNPLGK